MNKKSYRAKKGSSHYGEFIGKRIKSIQVSGIGNEVGASVSIVSTDGLELVIEPMSGEDGAAGLNVYVNP